MALAHIIRPLLPLYRDVQQNIRFLFPLHAAAERGRCPRGFGNTNAILAFILHKKGSLSGQATAGGLSSSLPWTNNMKGFLCLLADPFVLRIRH
jgi:hypothetical protein